MMLRIVLLPLLLSLLFACGGEEPLLPPATDGEPAHRRPEDDDHQGVSVGRFRPYEGLVGTRIQLVAPSSRPPSDYVMTIGGVPARVNETENEDVIEVVVPADARSGPLCATRGVHTSCGSTFTVLTRPQVHSISPATVQRGSSELLITVRGAAFKPDSEIRLDGAPLATRFESSTQLQATVPASYLDATKTGEIVVFTPTEPGRGSSEVRFLEVENPRPSIDQVEPAVVPADSCAPLYVTGQGFVEGSVLMVDELDLGTPFQSATSLVMRFNAALVTPGERELRVRNPAPGGGMSPPFVLVVQ